MNKYQEALKVCKGLYNYRDNLYVRPYEMNSATLDTIEGLVEKEEKYRWHDLRKNPENLPNFGIRRVLVAYKDNTEDFIFTNEALCTDGIFSEAGVIAWKYIEEFKDE